VQLKHPIQELLGGRMSIQVDIVVDHVTSDDEVDHGHLRLLGSLLNAGPRSDYRSNRLRRAKSLELVEAIEAAMGRNREIEKLSHERLLSLLNIMSSLKKRHSLALLFFCYQV